MTDHNNDTLKLQKPELEDLIKEGKRTIQPVDEENGGFKDKKVTIELTEDVKTEKVEAWRIE